MKGFKETDESMLSSFTQLPSGLMGRYEFLMNRPAQRIREMTEETLGPLKITPKQYGILASIHFEGHSTQRAISSMLKIDQTTMVILIDDLEEKGFVVRNDYPKDRRCYLLHLTPSGKELFKKAHKLVMKTEEKFLGPLSKMERKTLRKFLSKLFYYIPSQSKIVNDKYTQGHFC